MAQILLSAGVSPAVRDMWDKTPLMVAALSPGANTHVEVVRLLLEAGANPRVREHVSHGPTAYDYAEQHGRTKLASLLKQFMDK